MRHQSKIPTRDVIKFFWQESRKYPWLLFLLIVSMVAGTALSTIYPYFYKQFFDVIGTAEKTIAARDALVAIVTLILFIHFIEWVALRCVAYLDTIFTTRLMTNVRERAFNTLLNHSYSFFTNNFTGALVERVNKLSRAYERFFDRVYHNILPLALRITLVLCIIASQSMLFAGIMFIWIIFFLITNAVFSRWKLPYDTERSRRNSRTTAVLADSITNHMNIQLFSSRRFESAHYARALDHWRKSAVFSSNLGMMNEAVQGIIFILFEFAIFVFAARYWQEGLITIGTIFLLQAYMMQLIGRLWDFGKVIRDIYESIADAKEMVEIMDTPFGVSDVRAARPLIVKKGKIEFATVSFFYHESRPIFTDLKLIINPGERVAFVGPSGAGKSTIVKLMLRFYDVRSGQLRIDGQDLRDVTQDSIRSAIGFVPQEPILFHRTLMENIRYGRPTASDREVMAAAQKAYCDEFIDTLPLAYDTLVGERGIKLSGGERQRIAIARVVLKGAPILILDEATSSLDSHSEILIQHALGELMKGKTTIAIAHRLSTIKMMDRILVLDRGHVKEEGNHEELLKNTKGLYRKLWKLQSGGFIGDGA